MALMIDVHSAIACSTAPGGRAESSPCSSRRRIRREQRLLGNLTGATKSAVVALDPRTALIDLYVTDLTGSSIQGWKELKAVRDALGIPSTDLDDSALQIHQPFFNARHEASTNSTSSTPPGRAPAVAGTATSAPSATSATGHCASWRASSTPPPGPSRPPPERRRSRRKRRPGDA